jgi:kynurenine formamidase
MRIIRVVDLSVPVGAGTVVYPGDPEPALTVHSTIEHDGFNLLAVEMGSQTGTHVDAPFHFDAATPRIDELPLERFFGPAVVVDATGLPPRGRITWEEHVAPVASRLAPGTIVLLRTDWSAHYGTPTYFENPFLDADAARRVLELGVRTFCIDAINIDETPDDDHPGEGFPVHHLIAEAGGVIGENFRNVAAITWPDPVVSCFPIALEAADGAPVRAVAMELDATGAH